MKPNTLQDRFLQKLKKEKIAVTIFLVSGYQLRGLVEGYDNYTVIIRTGDVQQLIYKHAISTVVPSRPVSHHSNNAGGGTGSNYHHGSNAQGSSAPAQDSDETE